MQPYLSQKYHYFKNGHIPIQAFEKRENLEKRQKNYYTSPGAVLHPPI